MTDHYPTLRDLDDALVEVIGQMPEEHRQGMPPGPLDCARWLRSHVLEAPQRITRRDGSEAWRWPYLDRCLVLARRFLRLPAAEQRTILAAREDGIAWRGDDLETFMRIVGEHYRMRELGAQAYRAEALSQLRGLSLGGATKHHGAAA